MAATICMAPQKRSYWLHQFSGQNDTEILDHFRWAEDGLKRHGKKSQKHRHDWTIYRACTIRELRRRGLAIPASTL